MEKKKIVLGNPIRKEKIVIGGRSEEREVYRINIHDLFYNDENGRIATYMAEYNSNHDQPISSLSFEEYNKIIMEYVKKSGSSTKYKTTKDNIASLGQLKTGIVLEDGRVIDGNRRFTCLRELYEETKKEKYMYFECFVLPIPVRREDRVAIKTLELNYQFGEDQREDYNPIDRLVDIYRDLVGPEKMFTPKEYLERVNGMLKMSDLQLSIEKAKTLYDYLEFIGKPERWDIARDYKLDGPIQEIALKRKKLGEESDEWLELAPTLYSFLKQACGDSSKGDKTREIRKVIRIYDNEPSEFQNLKNKMFDISMRIETVDYISDMEDRKIAQRKLQQDLYNLDKNVSEAYTKIGNESAKNKNLKVFEDVERKLSEFDKVLVHRSSNDKIIELEKKIEDVEKIINRIKEEIKNAK